MLAGLDLDSTARALSADFHEQSIQEIQIGWLDLIFSIIGNFWLLFLAVTILAFVVGLFLWKFLARSCFLPYDSTVPFSNPKTSANTPETALSAGLSIRHGISASRIIGS